MMQKRLYLVLNYQVKIKLNIGKQIIKIKIIMSTNLQEVDLLQKYRQSISKRYRGYNRVYQLSVNKLNQHSNSHQAFAQNKSSITNKSPIVEIPRQCQSQTYKNIEKIPKSIVIRSTNAHFSFKQINEEAQLNNKKFIRTRLINPQKIEHEMKNQSKSEHERKQDSQNGQKNEQPKSHSPRDLQSSVEEYFENRFKFKKKFIKQSITNKFCFIQQNDKFIKEQLIRMQPFSPVIRGQKKNAHLPNSKKTKTQNETINHHDENTTTKRSFVNFTETKREKVNLSDNIKRIKRTNSYVTEKQDEQNEKVECMSASVQPSQIIKKFSSQFRSKNLLENKMQMAKVSFPKINCAKQTPIKAVQNKPILNVFIPYLELEKNKEKYKKTPLLIRYQFDVKNVDSQSFVVMEAQSQAILYGNRMNHGFQIASLTKIMTFYAVLGLIQQHKIDIKKELIQVQNECANIGGTSADLFPGQTYTLENLLYGLMLPSGNDAALTLAAWGGRLKIPNNEQIEYCISNFVTLMNKECKNLNLIDTRFANPHGLPHRMSRSSALDVAKLSIICMKNDLFRKVVNTKLYKCVAIYKDGRKRFNEWQNTNKLLRRQGFIGIKTGITITAGPCLASAYQFRDKTYITVVLRAIKVSRRFKQTRKILNWCMNKLYGDALSSDEINVLKKLKKNNQEIDSDYSEDENVFCYDTNNSKEFKRRCDIISEM